LTLEDTSHKCLLNRVLQGLDWIGIHSIFFNLHSIIICSYLLLFISPQTQTLCVGVHNFVSFSLTSPFRLLIALIRHPFIQFKHELKWWNQHTYTPLYFLALIPLHSMFMELNPRAMNQWSILFTFIFDHD